MYILELLELIAKAGVDLSKPIDTNVKIDVEKYLNVETVPYLQEQNRILRQEISMLKAEKDPEYFVVEHEHGECEDYYYRNEVFLSRAEAEAGFDERIKVAREDTWDDKIYLHKGGEDEHGRIVPVGEPLIEARFSKGY